MSTAAPHGSIGTTRPGSTRPGSTQLRSIYALPTHAQGTQTPRTQAPTTRLRLTRRGRIVFGTLGAAPLVALMLVTALNGGAAVASGAGSHGTTFEYVTISAGQSLWELAERLAPQHDPRDVIADIVALNQLSSSDVQPGQRLALPGGY